MIKLKDTYRGADMFELARQFNASFDDVTVFGFMRFLIDNGYQIDRFEQEEPTDDWRKEWITKELNALNGRVKCRVKCFER